MNGLHWTTYVRKSRDGVHCKFSSIMKHIQLCFCIFGVPHDICNSELYFFTANILIY
jgi:hypothetical protein